MGVCDVFGYVGCRVHHLGGVAMSFQRLCVACGDPIPDDRLRRGLITCQPDCAAADRKAYMLYRLALRRDKILASGWFRKSVKAAVRAAHSVSDDK